MHVMTCCFQHCAEQRPRDLVVRAQDETGQTISLSLGGESESDMWIARIFLHEYDHLQVCAYYSFIVTAAGMKSPELRAQCFPPALKNGDRASGMEIGLTGIGKAFND
jgi:hypothetical protein